MGVEPTRHALRISPELKSGRPTGDAVLPNQLCMFALVAILRDSALPCRLQITPLLAVPGHADAVEVFQYLNGQVAADA